MESFYSEPMAECEKKANQMVALENESTVMRGNDAGTERMHMKSK